MTTAKSETAITPLTKLMIVIGILQANLLAGDSPLDGPVMFKNTFMPEMGAEHAINLLIELIPDLETLEDKV